VKFNPVQILAFRTANVIILLFLILYLIFKFVSGLEMVLPGFILFVFILYLVIFVVIKHNLERFAGKKIQKIFTQSDLFRNINFDKKNVKADFNSFFNHISEVIDKKHEEIEELLMRDDFRKDFLGNVSHELKTPLFTAQGYILTLMDGSIDDVELQKKYLERAYRSIERLEFIVKDLDLISKLESGMNLNYQNFNILKLIADVFEILELKAAKRNITLNFNKSYEFPILVNADVERIEQVLINLIANSINYGKENGSTLVSVQLASNNKFKISVSDNGIGIKEHNIPRLFERFYRVDSSRSREHGGSGLGLSIVKHIIEAHDQELLVESKLGTGTTFSFTLNSVT
jgi:two-component system phosphate regulon sensor histidine kinase PhoR